ncbi:hypothetical protein Pmar_PMAR001778 [Perkinsus marinus ATCC 50983]|uniref:Uncharacterized protein n=1 Tax=Perkinsus marinus (strain ATCC 50983 / TXsc) TaxID=423536 RepID=C5LJL8_PERM5|nr:hypothetical protein Pmar_PMAR001778 [Perkinsus marinus ATCC 50983]EER03035.1 hypothetical protein Pmar_PMAR001778 [Perkinsus marinus ATCC 50983]|eukprot:XP_002771219.1 hypothetical protein Pmar_PMAR001778 [Perkinsus marinus ATCC 50983]
MEFQPSDMKNTFQDSRNCIIGCRGNIYVLIIHIQWSFTTCFTWSGVVKLGENAIFNAVICIPLVSKYYSAEVLDAIETLEKDNIIHQPNLQEWYEELLRRPRTPEALRRAERSKAILLEWLRQLYISYQNGILDISRHRDVLPGKNKVLLIQELVTPLARAHDMMREKKQPLFSDNGQTSEFNLIKARLSRKGMGIVDNVYLENTLHRNKLPVVMRNLGDAYVKKEFRIHLLLGGVTFVITEVMAG